METEQLLPQLSTAVRSALSEISEFHFREVKVKRKWEKQQYGPASARSLEDIRDEKLKARLAFEEVKEQLLKSR